MACVPWVCYHIAPFIAFILSPPLPHNPKPRPHTIHISPPPHYQITLLERPREAPAQLQKAQSKNQPQAQFSSFSASSFFPPTPVRVIHPHPHHARLNTQSHTL